MDNEYSFDCLKIPCVFPQFDSTENYFNFFN